MPINNRIVPALSPARKNPRHSRSEGRQRDSGLLKFASSPGLDGVLHDRPSLRIGLFGIGLEAYWPQFKGLKERLEGYLGDVKERLQREGGTVVNIGLNE